MSQWPHSPLHILKEQGVYMVTAGTYQKEHLFKSNEKLSVLHDNLLSYAKKFGWELHAWAVFSNHYLFIGMSPQDPASLRIWIAQFHQATSSLLNKMDNCLGRKVWHQYWDSNINIQTSYLARLNYVHKNAEKHKVVDVASNYPWCSANRFELNASQSFVKSVYSFDYNQVNIPDEF